MDHRNGNCLHRCQTVCPHGFMLPSNPKLCPTRDLCQKQADKSNAATKRTQRIYIYILYICQKKITEITQMLLGFTCRGGKKSITSACLLAGVGLLSRDTSPLHPESQTATNSWLVSHSWQAKSSECYFQVRNEKKWQDIKFSTMSLCWQIRHFKKKCKTN